MQSTSPLLVSWVSSLPHVPSLPAKVVQVRSRRLSFLAAEHQQTYRFSLLLSPCPCLALESGQFENCKGVNDSPAASKRQRCLTRTGLSLLLVQRW